MSISGTKCDELESLKKENMFLQHTIENSKIGNKSLNMILANQSCVSREEELAS